MRIKITIQFSKRVSSTCPKNYIPDAYYFIDMINRDTFYIKTHNRKDEYYQEKKSNYRLPKIILVLKFYPDPIYIRGMLITKPVKCNCYNKTNKEHKHPKVP